MILLFNYTVVFVSAGCIWYDECGDGWNGGKLNCNYTGPAKLLTDVRGLDLLQTYCPDLYNGNNLSFTCCSTNQLMTFAGNMDLPKQFFSRCPACYHNFLNIYCDMTCNPDQDKFVWVNGTRSNPDKLAVTAITYFMAEEFAWGMFNSCKDVQIPSANDKAISIFCGTKAKDCTPQKWLSYNGDVYNGNAPFPVEFRIQNTNWTSPNKTVLVPISHKTVPCDQTTNDNSLLSVLEELAATNQISTDQLFLRYQHDIRSVLYFRSFFRTEQVLISRPANQQTKVTHQMPPPSVETMDFTSLFDKDFMKEVLELQTDITNLAAMWNGRNVSLSDICFKPLAPDYKDCAIESPLQFYQNDPQNLDKVAYDDAGFFVLADYLDHFLHCVQAPTFISDFTPLNMSCLSKYGAPVFPRLILGGFDSDNYQNSTVFVLTFVVNNHLNKKDNAMAEAWEKVFIDYMKNYKNDHMIISFSSEGLVNDLIPAADKNVQNHLQKLLKKGKAEAEKTGMDTKWRILKPKSSI